MKIFINSHNKNDIAINHLLESMQKYDSVYGHVVFNSTTSILFKKSFDVKKLIIYTFDIIIC